MAGRVVEIVFLASTADAEAKMARLGVTAKETGNVIGDSFDKGTTRAGNMLERLGRQGQSFGVPFAGHLTTVGEKFEEADTKGQKFEQTMSTIGGATLLAAGAAMAGVSVEAVKLSMSFQKSVASIAGNSDITIAKAKKIGDAFLGTAGYMTMSGNEMAAAFAPVAGQLKITEGSALNAGQALGYMKVAADLAEGSQTDLGSATAALTQVMQSFHLSLGQASGASDLLFNVSRSLNVPITGVAAAIDKLHGRLGILMPSMSDVGALMIALGQHGIMGSRGIQVAQTALTKLTSDTPATKTVLDELGVSVTNSQGKFIGMGALIDQLRPKLERLTQSSQENALTALFGSSAWEVMGQIIGAGVPKFDQATGAATKLGTAHSAAEKQAHTFQGQMKILGATLEDVATKIGNFLIPIIQTLGGSLASAIQWLEKGGTAADALGVVIAGTLGLAVAVFAEQKAVKFAGAIKNMMGDIEQLGSKLVGLTGIFQSEGDKQVAATEGTAAQVEASNATVEGSNATAGASFTAVGTEAEAGAATVGTAVGSEVAEVTAADATIETENAAAGASLAGIGIRGALGLGGAALGAGVAGYSLAMLLGGGAKDQGKRTSELPSVTLPPSATKSVSAATKYLQGSGLSQGAAQTEAANYFAQEAKQQDATKNSKTLDAFFRSIGYTKTQAASKTADYFNSREAVANAALPGVAGSATTANPTQLLSFLQKSLGLTKNQAAGIVGNIGGAEDSTFQANRVQGAGDQTGSTIASAGAGGYGLAQWTDPGRKAGLAALAAKMGLGQDSVKVQEAYIVQELKTGYAGVLSQLKGTTTAAQAAQVIEGPGGYENPADPGATLLARQRYATAIAGGKVPAGGSGLTTGTGTLANPSTALTTQTGVAGGNQALASTVASINEALTSSLDKYAAAAQSAVSPALATLNTQFAAQVAELKATFDKHAASLKATFDKNSKGQTGSALASAEENLKSALTSATETEKNRLSAIQSRATTQLALGGRGVSEETSLQSAITSGTQNTLRTATTGTHAAAEQTLVKELDATHQAVLEQMAKTIESDYSSAQQELTQVLATNQNNALGEQEQLLAAQTAKQTSDMADAAKLMTQSVTDMAQTVSDHFAAAATAITDATQTASDVASGQATAISDAAQTQVDQLGERGLYGLNLIAQQQKVAADQQKTSFDAQITTAQGAVDAAQTSGDNAGAAQTAIVDAVTAQQNVLVGQAQQNLDDVTGQQNVLVQAAQNQVTKASTESTTQQNAAAAALAAAQGTAASTEATANQALTSAQDASSQAIAQANSALSNANGQASVVIAQAQQALGQAQDQATVAEAQSQAQIAITQEEASTQFAGSGMTVNILGVASADELEDQMNWLGRSLFQVPVQAGV